MQLIMFNGPPQSYKSTTAKELQTLLEPHGLVARVGVTDFIKPAFLALMEVLDPELRFSTRPASDDDFYEELKRRRVLDTNGREILISVLDGLRAGSLGNKGIMDVAVARIKATRADFVIVDNVKDAYELVCLNAVAAKPNRRLYYFTEKRFKHAYTHGDTFIDDNRICLSELADSNFDPSPEQILRDLGY